MNTEQTNRITMMKTVTVYMDGQNAVWNGMAPMVTAVQSFKEKLTAIDTAAQQQEAPSGCFALAGLGPHPTPIPWAWPWADMLRPFGATERSARGPDWFRPAIAILQNTMLYTNFVPFG